MRLIDADALKEQGWIMHRTVAVNPQTIEMQMKKPTDFPTIDPVKHGKWMHDKDDVLYSGYCSCCGWTAVIMETDVADMPFCPNCGALMDKGDEE